MHKTAIEIIQDPKALAALREEWDELLACSSSNTLFLTWNWLYTWWNHLGGRRKLRIWTLRAQGRLLGLAPLGIRPARWLGLVPQSLEPLGTGQSGADYLDVIVRGGFEEQVLDLLAEDLARQGLVLDLVQLSMRARAATMLGSRMQHRRWQVHEKVTGICPYITLAGHSWDSYLGSLGSAHRSNFKRRIGGLAKRFCVRLEQASTEEQRRQALGLLVRLHLERWSARGGSDAFHQPALLSFHDEFSRLALQSGWLRLYVLRLDEAPAASLYGFLYNRKFYFYQSGFDPAYARYGVGLVTMGLAIQKALEEGAGEYDLLHGAEPYKFLWASESRDLARMEFYPPGISGLLRRKVRQWTRGAKRTGRILFFKPGLAAIARRNPAIEA